MGHGGFMPSMGMGPMNCAPQAQPLPSNVLSKGGDRTMDQQYMQQSSQIYVFSTQWANRSAEAVMQEHFPSIIAWHEAQPETKKHLEVSEQGEVQLGCLKTKKSWVWSLTASNSFIRRNQDP